MNSWDSSLSQATSGAHTTALGLTHPPGTELSSLPPVLAGENPEESCKKAERLLKTIQGWPDDEVPNKTELIGNLHSCIGHAQLEMGRAEAALESHRMALATARQQ